MPYFDTHENRHIRISDLATTEDIILDTQFERCTIVGPAVLLILNDVVLEANTLEGDLEALLWEVSPTRSKIIGAIGIQNCRFDHCRFSRVGFAGTAELLQQFRADMAGPI